ncbi:hypothetical protein Q8A67_005218 [Cirrhinus molitorella]|uniref:Uncharacterized protein n=1 Tax=Cirrhinus molitorella TaxID=172907 RepID=A0AA88PZI0_9TELE|nr:hypothetical protein Q8A67_005218 [Cirrhinus molitorella]
MIILSNVVIDKSQGHWYCTPLVNSSSCTNSSSYVDCLGQNVSCKAYSCDSQSTSCTCKIGSYHCSNYSYEASPDVCTCKENTCRCLKDMIDNPGSIAGAAENYLKIVDDTQVKVVTSVNAEDKSKLVSYGNTYLNAFENLVSALVTPTANYTLQNINLDKTEVEIFMVGPLVTLEKIPRLNTTNSSMDIDLIGIAKNNDERSAAVAFMSYTTMENLLKPDFFNTPNDTIKIMMSTVISATLPKTTNTKLTKPVNFTFRHIREFDPSGSLSCVYWNISEWIVDGCSVLETNSSYTVCSCDHLSTFALIMQTSRPPESDSLLHLLNLVCVIVGLVFFSLALLTFALCQWSPGVNNVARINICISLLLAHLLFLLTQQFLSVIRPQQVLCAVISGLLHFLFLSGFVWMFIEAVLLFICVKNLSQISSKKKEVLSSGFLCVIGYLVALVVVCVSVGLVPEGYGSEDCWIKRDKGFIWSFLGPVCVILALNTILFISIMINLNSTLTKLNAEVSQMKQTKIILFKTMAQFVVLGCSWILGFFTNGSKVLEILFLILNSQQGTFIFLIYCVLNNESYRLLLLLRVQHLHLNHAQSNYCSSEYHTAKSMHEGQVFMVGPNVNLNKIPRLDTTNSSAHIDLIGIAKSNEERSAAVAFMSYNKMENLLKPDFFNTSNDTIKTMMSTVISATLPKTPKTTLTEQVNFTFRHIREFDPSGSLSCVYWNISEWIVDGCSVLETSSSYTVCSCDHLSTFALIMQTSRPPERDLQLDLLHLVCVIVGLVFFSLALLTFALCQWSPGVNNVARINICISLLLAHLLFLLTQQFLSVIRPQQVLCAVISGLLHFLFLSGFVWMFIEAVLLFICVKNLSQISSKKKEVLSSGFMCVIGYLVALVVVCVSVGLVPEGYGSEQIMTFKILAQFVVLGCPWILGFFINDSKVLEILFLIVNSQQGTFIFLIYCVLNKETVVSILNVAFNTSEKILETSSTANQTELASYGNRMLKTSEKLISTLVKPTDTSDSVNFTLPAVEGQVFMVGPKVTLNKIPRLDTTNSSVDIDLIGIAKSNEENSAAVAFMSYNTMENLLKPDFFNTSNGTNKTMMSTVISATLPKTTNTTLTKPVNFTFRHIREFDPSGSLSCVYWNISEWIVDGCSVLKTNSSYTVCSCDHLSTFALIMQTSRPPESDSQLELLSLVCVIVGLVFFSLALLTFALCQWSPGVNNVARINICISLLLAHLLFLLTQQFLSVIRPQQVLCAVISGLLHFLFLSGFVWMFIEAVLLFICVENLSQISSRNREVLSRQFLCVIGYLVALVVVAVSAVADPKGYGSEMIIVFKTLAQFVVLGCSWILGFFTNSSKELEILFLILNSQQGTFIFLIYCVLNNEVTLDKIPQLRTTNASVDIDLIGVANNNNERRSAAVAFMSYNTMENLLKPDFFNTSNDTIKIMMSTVISATLPKTTNTTLTKPVNFTFRHIREFKPSGSLSCVYWNISEWIVDGCSVLETNSSYTVCSCDHLSTFALIMQTSSPPERDLQLELLSLVCVIVGLVFFSLALLTFALCQWSPGVNNVARINICISLLLAHLLFLLTQQFLSVIRPQQVLCAVISGLLHFLFLSGFVWMFIESVMLFICVKNLSQISSKKTEVLRSRFLCVIGYLVALAVVAVSAGLFPKGYGSKHCWIKMEKGFIWSFLGPVSIILALNMILFICIVITLNSTLTKLNAEVSQIKQTKIMVFKTLAQFVVLGCPWILGFFTNGSKVLEILFLIVNSQQGTFIFLIYCVLNNEVRKQYRKFFRCLCCAKQH